MGGALRYPIAIFATDCAGMGRDPSAPQWKGVAWDLGTGIAQNSGVGPICHLLVSYDIPSCKLCQFSHSRPPPGFQRSARRPAGERWNNRLEWNGCVLPTRPR